MVTIEFFNFASGRHSPLYGPYEFVQVTYNSVRVGPDGDDFIAQYTHGYWMTEDDQRWTDFSVTTVKKQGQ